MEKTISSLNYQLGKIEELIKKDLKNKTFIYNFFVNEYSEKLLDLDSLIDFLSQTTIAKTLFLSTIVKKCMRIIDYWNNDSFELEKEELYSYYNESTGVFVNSQSKFHCIVLKPFEWQFLNTESELNYFFDNYNYKIYSIQQIAKRCTIIINWITTNYPETMPDETKKENDKPETIVESPFSVSEWATIFYYANETKLLPEARTIKERMEQFINKYEINTTLNYFRTQYYEAKKRINKKNDYPINKLKLIIPFLKENYKQTVTKVENEIIFLEENMTEY